MPRRPKIDFYGGGGAYRRSVGRYVEILNGIAPRSKVLPTVSVVTKSSVLSIARYQKNYKKLIENNLKLIPNFSTINVFFSLSLSYTLSRKVYVIENVQDLMIL